MTDVRSQTQFNSAPCGACGQVPVAAGRRKYCDGCGPRASALRKHELRRAAIAAWRQARKLAPQVPPPYLAGWASRETYNAYWRERMRMHRERQRERQRVSAAALVPTETSATTVEVNHENA